jgi:hypothetical protein
MSEKTKVTRIQIKGVEYYRDAENNLYDPKTKEVIGIWNPETKKIEPLSDDEDDIQFEGSEFEIKQNIWTYTIVISNKEIEETPVEEDDDGNITEWSYSFPIFWNGVIESKTERTNIMELIPDFPKDYRVGTFTLYTKKILIDDNEKAKKILSKANSNDSSSSNYSWIFDGDIGDEIQKLINEGELEGKKDSEKTIADRKRREEGLKRLEETRLARKAEREEEEKINNPDYIESSILELQEEIKLETSPDKLKILNKLVKGLEKKLAALIKIRDEQAEYQRITFGSKEEQEQKRQKEKEDLEALKKQLRNEKAKATREKNKKEKEEKEARLLAEKEEKEAKEQLEAAKEQLEAKRIQYKALDDARKKFRKVAYSYEYLVDDPEKPNVSRGRDVMKTTAGIREWLEVKEMLKNLPVEDVDWYYDLKADMERFLDTNKEYAVLNAYNLYREYKSQVSNPTIWETGGNNETKSGIAKRDALVAKASKDKLEMEGILRDNFTKAERDKAIDTINSKIRKEREEYEERKRKYEALMEQDKKDRKEKRRLEKEKEGTGIIDNTKLYQQVKDAADIIYDKPSAYKSGFIVKKYKEMGGTYSGKKDNKGIGRWFKEDWKDIGNKEYPVFRPTKRITKDTPLTPDEIKPSNLKKQIALKQVLKGNANLPPFQEKTGGKVVSLGQSANNISESDEVYKFSNPKKVQELANKYLGKDGTIYRSINKAKKYMVYNPNTKKWVHFGQMGYEDFTKHKDPKRQKNYLTRTANIKGDWKDDKYSPNNLSRNLLW